MRTFTLLALAILLLLLAAGGLGSTPAQASHAGGADFFAVDMDPSSTPANTATSLGSIEGCARIVNNDAQDGDEDAVDTVTVDIVVSNIPSTEPMMVFGYDLIYDESVLTIETADSDYLLTANEGSELYETTVTPDIDGDDIFYAGALDISHPYVYPAESGSGVLQRLTISAESDASAGLTGLTFKAAMHADPALGAYPPDSLIHAQIALDDYCPGVDYDGDGVWDHDEARCGGVPLNASLRPERIDGVFATVDDNGDTQVDEALPAGSESYDCDGDGYTGDAEAHVYAPDTQADQDPCGTNVLPPTVPASPVGWPADLRGGGIPESTNKINILDMASFSAPVAYMNTDVGTNPGDLRWDIVPGKSGLIYDINIIDLSSMSTVSPAMLGNARALNGPPCPWPQ